MANFSNDPTLRIKLENPASTTDARGNRTERIVFNVTPSLTESGTATYRNVEPTQAPGSFHVYEGSSLRQFSLDDVKLLARTVDEAKDKLRIMNLIRGWTKPYFGRGNAANKNGLPPDVLLLSAYGYRNLVRIPVIIQSYSISYPNDTDYLHIPRESSEQGAGAVAESLVPIVSTVTLQLQEVRSMTEMNSFNLTSYKLGDLGSWGGFG